MISKLSLISVSITVWLQWLYSATTNNEEGSSVQHPSVVNEFTAFRRNRFYSAAVIDIVLYMIKALRLDGSWNSRKSGVQKGRLLWFPTLFLSLKLKEMLKSFGGISVLMWRFEKQLSCRDNLLARKRRQTNCMLIQGRFSTIKQFNEINQPSNERKKQKKTGKFNCKLYVVITQFWIIQTNLTTGNLWR